jgi:hypothetical protein
MKKSVFEYLTLSVIIFSCFVFLENNYWSTKWFVLLIGLVVYFSYEVGSKTHWSIGLCLLYFLLNTVSRYALTNTFNSTAGIQNLMMYGMVYSSFTVCMFCFFLSEIKDKYETALFNAFMLFVLVNSIAVIAQKTMFSGMGDTKYFLGETSMAGCLMGLFCPMIIHKANGYWKYSVMLVLAAVVLSDSTTAIAVTAVSLTCYLFSDFIKYKDFKLAVLFCSLILACGVIVGVIFNGEGFFDSGGRFQNQLAILKLTLAHMNPFFGYGGGSYMFLGPNIQRLLGQELLWQHPHSDFLKVIFEQGFVGLFLASIVCVVSLKKSIGKPWLFGMVCGVYFYSVVQYPSFLPVHSFICLAVIMRALKVKT